MSDWIDQQQPGSPFYWMKETREREAAEDDSKQRAFNDWQIATRGSYISPRFQFECAFRILGHYYDMKPRYRRASVYPCDATALRKELREATIEEQDE